MKKIYLFGFAALACTLATAQTTMKMKLNKKGAKSEAVAKAGTPSVNQIAGTILCQTQYVAGTTMDLNFTITLTNTDFEYGDSVAITFPAGITPNTSATNSDPIATDAADPGPDGPEALNPISGQTISWGNNDNNWGGVVSDGTAYPFTVNVTIAPGTTGNLVAAYHVSGDQYPATPGDLNGNVTIFEAGATINDAAATIGGVQGTSYCANTNLPIAVRIKNLGNTAISNFPVSYQIDANPVVTETVTASIAVGDSLDYAFTTLGNFSAEAEYAVAIYTGLSGDAITANDTINTFWMNTIPVALTSTAYANDFETNADFLALTTEPISGNGNWGISQVTFQSGAQALFYTATAATNEAWVFLKCMDVVANDNYRVTYWTRTNTGNVGSLGVSYGSTQDAAGMTNTIKAVTANTANSTWVKDSADFTPSTSGTIYVGFNGQGTNNTNVRLDNINIFKVISTGVSEVSSSTVAIYPNPSNGIINVNVTSKEAMLAVYNVLGEQVINVKAFSGNNTIDLSSFSAGTYFVRVTENEKVITKKINLTK